MFIKSVLIYNRHFPGKGQYPFYLEVLRETDELKLHSRVVFFVGQNGSGKSTLMEAVARRYGLTVWGGEKSHTLHRNPYETRLYEFIALETSEPLAGIRKGFLFRAENFFNYASYLDDVTMDDPNILSFYGGQSLNEQSHGEAFLSFFESRCRLKGVYLLDEPEAALSPFNQMGFLKLLMELSEQGNSQFIISTHSPIILACPGAQILSFDFAPIREIGYEETHSFRFYKQFMEDREALLKEWSGSAPDPGRRENGNRKL